MINASLTMKLDKDLKSRFSS